MVYKIAQILVILKLKCNFAPLNNRGRVPQINQKDYVSKN